MSRAPYHLPQRCSQWQNIIPSFPNSLVPPLHFLAGMSRDQQLPASLSIGVPFSAFYPLQFLAVGVHPPNVSNIPSGKAFHGKGTVQIWKIEETPPTSKAAAGRKGKQKVQEGPGPKQRVAGKVSSVRLVVLTSAAEGMYAQCAEGCWRIKLHMRTSFLA